MTEPVAFLTGFPMGPSVNECYRNLRMKGRVKAACYRQFEKSAEIWFAANLDAIARAKDLLKDVGPGIGIRATYTFCFDPLRVLTKMQTPKNGASRKKEKNESKTLDVGNYLKAVEDVLCKMLGVDDCYFWSVTLEKSIVVYGPERVNIRLSLLNHPIV